MDKGYVNYLAVDPAGKLRYNLGGALSNQIITSNSPVLL